MVDQPDDSAWEAALRQPDDLVRGAASASFGARLDRWVEEARVDAAAVGRGRERWLREVAEQEATLVGVLIDLAERGVPVTLQLHGGRRHQGVVRGVGADFVALTIAAGSDVLVAVAGIDTVRTAPDVPATVGDRVADTELLLSDVLAELAADREQVRVVTRDGDAIAGQLRSVGHDVAVLRTQAAQPATVYVAVTAISEVAIG